jgi:hypothetical protein
MGRKEEESVIEKLTELNAKLDQIQTYVTNCLDSGTFGMTYIENKFNEMKLIINNSIESNKEELTAS